MKRLIGSLLGLVAGMCLIACSGSDVPIGEKEGQGGSGTGGQAQGGSAGTAGQATGGIGGGGGSGGSSSPTEAVSDKPRNTSPSVPESEYQQFINDNNAFAFEMYRQLAPSSEAVSNLFFSPASITVALGMTYAGAKGTTETQMAQAMHFSLPQSRLHENMNRLTLDLASRCLAPHVTDEGTKSVKLQLVDAAWAQTGYPLVPDYLDTLAVNYGAGVKLLDFQADPAAATRTINTWVAEQTEQKITNLIPDGSIDSMTRLVLTNTLYFYANWGRLFSPDYTDDAVFHAGNGDVTVATMSGPTMPLTRYAQGDGWQAIDLPYDGAQTSMMIILPDEGRYQDVAQSLSATWLTQTVQQMDSPADVTISMPKFKFTWGTKSLKPLLKNLGMQDAFVQGVANFTGMNTSGELFVGDVLHKAFVGVDENGTEAAAATAVVMQGGGMPTHVDVNRPFLFLIRDATGSILFLGQVADPSGS